MPSAQERVCGEIEAHYAEAPCRRTEKTAWPKPPPTSIVLVILQPYWLFFGLPADWRRLRKLRQVSDSDIVPREPGSPGAV